MRAEHHDGPFPPGYAEAAATHIRVEMRARVGPEPARLEPPKRCAWTRGFVERGLMDHEAPPGVTFYQRHTADERDMYGRVVYGTRYVAGCRCGAASGPEKLRCDAINALAALHK